MSLNNGSRIGNTISTTGPFPAVREEELEGSFRSVPSETDRLAIPIPRLKTGMLVWDIDTSSYHRYVSNPPATNTVADWESVTFGGEPGSPGSVTTVTVTELIDLWSTQTLTPGVWYRFPYSAQYAQQNDPSAPDVVGPEEPIMVMAASNSGFGPYAISTGYLPTETVPSGSSAAGYPADVIHWSITGRPDNPQAFKLASWAGEVLLRRDTVYGLETHYDFRGIRFLRYSNTQDPASYVTNPHPGASYLLDDGSIPPSAFPLASATVLIGVTVTPVTFSLEPWSLEDMYTNMQSLNTPTSLYFTVYKDSGVSYLRASYVGNIDTGVISITGADSIVYTFYPTMLDISSGYYISAWTFGATLGGNVSLATVGSREPTTCSNVKIGHDYTVSTTRLTPGYLPNAVFGEGCCNAYVGGSARNITVAEYSESIKIGERSSEIVALGTCARLNVGDDCSNVTVLDGCTDISVHDGSSSVSVGYFCQDVRVRSKSTYLSFGDSCAALDIDTEVYAWNIDPSTQNCGISGGSNTFVKAVPADHITGTTAKLPYGWAGTYTFAGVSTVDTVTSTGYAPVMEFRLMPESSGDVLVLNGTSVLGAGANSLIMYTPSVTLTGDTADSASFKRDSLGYIRQTESSSYV